MKEYKIQEFFGTVDKEPKEGDYLYKSEIRLTNSFPFLSINVLITYKLIDGEWIEQ